MRELDVLKDKRDVNLAATMTLMLGHKYSQTVGTYDTKTSFTVFKTEKILINIQINYNRFCKSNYCIQSYIFKSFSEVGKT